MRSYESYIRFHVGARAPRNSNRWLDPGKRLGVVVSDQAAIGDNIAKAADRAGPVAMRLPVFFVLTALLAACSPEADQQADAGRDASEATETAAIKSARQACKHLRKPRVEHKFDVGISDYEACLGGRANLTRPANGQLCDLAKSTMSPSGKCVLGE